MNDLEITPEDGSPSVSLENVYKMTKTHGTPVAISHAITPQREHVTKIFFFDGQSHTAYGFAIGLDIKNKDENHFAKVYALEIAVYMIFGLPITIDREIFTTAGRNEDDEKIFAEEKNVVYYFLAPDTATLTMIMNCEGIITFENQDKILKEEENVVKVCDYV